MKHRRRMAIGAEVLPEGGVHFRVWAPRCRRVDLVLEHENDRGAGRKEPRPDESAQLQPESDGYFSALLPGVHAGQRYRFRLDGRPECYPDPASRFQPEGPHGPSEVVDPSRFTWSDRQWRGVALEGQVIYEMHIGTFTPEGTWDSAIRQLEELASCGITLLEVMPVAEFPGRFGWGYDGVDLFAPTRLYGRPDEFRRFVDRAHAVGLGVILDVVYNHVGPDGNYLKQFSDHYFTDRYKNDWGEAINFDGDSAEQVREFFLANAGYWIDEFHLDGLRLDATQQIFDRSRESILAAIGRRVREAGRGRATLVVSENEIQDATQVRPLERGGHGLDCVWNDDFHHSAFVALAAHNEAYYSDYLGNPQELISALKWGFLYQGQRSKWHKKRRGTPALDIPPARFVNFIQNHDQIANSSRGLRCHLLSSPGRHKALTALLLLGPATPLLFQGQEFAASSPFLYFADHNPELAALVRRGRAEFVAQFPSIALPEVQATISNPSDRLTFERCKLDFTERERHAEIYQMHRDLLRLRRDDPVFRRQQPRGVDGAVLGPQVFVLRFFADDDNDRLLLVNLGRDVHMDPAPEPLLAPPTGKAWRLLWSSEDIRYAGASTPPLDTDDNWRIPGEAAVALAPE